jgi:hypothetical protein
MKERKIRRDEDRKLLERLHELSEGLHRYGQHVTGCLNLQAVSNPCSCGLTKLLTDNKLNEN